MKAIKRKYIKSLGVAMALATMSVTSVFAAEAPVPENPNQHYAKGQQQKHPELQGQEPPAVGAQSPLAEQSKLEGMNPKGPDVRPIEDQPQHHPDVKGQEQDKNYQQNKHEKDKYQQDKHQQDKHQQDKHGKQPVQSYKKFNPKDVKAVKYHDKKIAEKTSISPKDNQDKRDIFGNWAQAAE